MFITDINELLTNVFQEKCYLEDDLSSFYKLKFPNISNIQEFSDIKDNIEIFLSQYDMKTGTMVMLYPEASKFFVLPINKLPLDQLLEKLNALLKDSQLHEAVNPNGILQIKKCLDNGANINNKNIVGDTVLHIATRKDYFSIVSLLLEKGASINILNHKGETPLRIVDQNNDAVMGKAFIETILDPKAEKPDLTMQILINYWDERIQKLANKLPIQGPTEESVKGELNTTSGAPKIRNIIQFFSENSLNDNKPLQEPPTVANLDK
jgi:ankyrin repeat protein